MLPDKVSPTQLCAEPWSNTDKRRHRKMMAGFMAEAGIAEEVVLKPLLSVSLLTCFRSSWFLPGRETLVNRRNSGLGRFIERIREKKRWQGGGRRCVAGVVCGSFFRKAEEGMNNERVDGELLYAFFFCDKTCLVEQRARLRSVAPVSCPTCWR